MRHASPIRVAALAAMLACGANAAAQTPTGEKPVGTSGTTAEAKEEKKDTTDEQGIDPLNRPSGFFEKTKAWADKQQDRFGRITKPITDAGFSASIGTLGQGSGLAASLNWHGEQIFGSPIDVESTAGYSYHGYALYDVRFGQLRNFKRRTTLRSADAHIATQFDAYKEREIGLGIYGNIRYRHSPQHRYWGLGPDTVDSDRTSFLLRGASYELVTEYQRSDFFGVAARGGILDFEVGPGNDPDIPPTGARFDDTTAPGLRRQPAYAHVAAGTSFDTRDLATMPRTGGLLGVLVSRFHALNVGPENLSFNRFAVDGRYFVPATSRSVVALRLLALRDFADSGGRVPFYLQQTLGGGDTMRGFDRARFRDNALMTASAEFRFDAHKYVELAAFGDAGQVADSLTALAPGRFETSWGAGVRFKNKDSILFRADWATSREGNRFIFSTGPVF